MPLENSSDRKKEPNTKANRKVTIDFVKQQLIIDTSSDYLRERMDEGSSSQQQNNMKETDSTKLHDKTGSSDHLRPLDQVEQRQATLTEQHKVHDQADPRRQTSDHLRPRDQQTAPDNKEEKEILNLLTPEERQAFKSGDEKSKKKELAKQIYGSAQLMKTLRRTNSQIEAFVNFSVRSLREYKEHYGNAASSSQHQGEINEGSLPQQHREINEGSLPQQHREIIVLSDSEEDAEKSPKQKQPSESHTHEREKWQSDQAQEETSPNTGQRIDSATHQYQLYEQQQSKGKELDPMEIHDKIGSSDYLRLLDQFGQGLATPTEQHEVHDQADPTRQADASSHSDHLGVDLDVMFGSIELRDSKVEELNKEIEKCNQEIKKCKVYCKQKNREIQAKRANIAEIYHKNKNLMTENVESIINTLKSKYTEMITNDLASEYKGKPINALNSEYTEKIIHDLNSKYGRNFITYLSSNHTENFINGLISEYKEGIKGAQNPEEVKKIEGKFISSYTSKGFDTKSSEELIKLVREINNLQELIQTNQHLISYYERQRDKIPSGRNETSNQAEASGLADHLEASFDNLDLEIGDLEFRKPHDQIQATSSHTNARSERQFLNEVQQGETAQMEVVPQNATWYQSFSEIQQPFAAHNATEAQHESTSQQADVRRQDQIEQRQDTIVQQHERYDQAGLRSEEEIKHRLRAFVANLMQEKKRLTENRVKGMLNQYNIYTKEDLRHYYNCVRELYNEESYEPLRQRYGSISFHIRQQLTQRQ